MDANIQETLVKTSITTLILEKANEYLRDNLILHLLVAPIQDKLATDWAQLEGQLQLLLECWMLNAEC